jgi:acetyl-CoA C-acetyltransferase
MKDVVIVSAVRTPIGKFLGSLSNIPAPKLGSIVIREAIRRINLDPKDIDEVIIGNVLSAGLGQAPARQASIFAGIPYHVPAFTVNKVCASGLKAVVLGAEMIKANDANIVVAGGMENMSLAPYLLDKARTGYRLGPGVLIDEMIKDGLIDVYNNVHMGVCAEYVAERYNISRQMQDEFALASYKKAIAAIDNGYFKEEIVPVEVEIGKEKKLITEDEEPKSVDLSKLPNLKPVFKSDGTVTAGNASKISDGAACVILMSEEEAKKRRLPILARIVGYTQYSDDPKWVLITPIYSIPKLLEKYNLKKEDISLFEINEAFSVSSCAVNKELELDPNKVNIHGGAVALGHPIGASGTRILVTLIYALKRINGNRGIATLCNGGGEAVAVLIER